MLRAAIAALLLLCTPCMAAAQTRGTLAIDVAGADGRKQPHQLYSASHALVIGINRYTEKGWPPLRNAIADAEKVASALSAQGFEVSLRKDLKSAELFPALQEFFITKGRDPNARLFLWYAGHGHTMTVPSEEGYLVPADAPSADTDAAFRIKAVAMSQFTYLMTQANAKHVLAVFDSCFSGTALDISRDAEMTVPAEINLQTGGRARQMIAAGDRNQRVSDNGVFRQVFLDAIAGKVPGVGRNGYVTAQEIGTYLRRELPRITFRTASPQTPQTGYLARAGYNHGDFVFRIPQAAIEPPPAPPPVPKVAAPPQAPPVSDAVREWAGVDKTSLAELETFVRRHGASPEADYARARIESLRKTAAVPSRSTPPEPPKPVPSRPAPTPEPPKPSAMATPPAPAPRQEVFDARSVFFEEQLSGQTISRSGPDVGARVVAGSLLLGKVEAVIVQEDRTAGWLFKHQDKLVALRAGTAAVRRVGPSVVLTLQDAGKTLASLPPYKLAPPPAAAPAVPAPTLTLPITPPTISGPAAPAAPPAANAASPAPSFPFLGEQLPEQAIVRTGRDIGRKVRSPTDTLGTIEATIVEKGEVVGWLFKYKRKLIGLRAASTVVYRRDPDVFLNLFEAQSELDKQAPYKLATGQPTARKDAPGAEQDWAKWLWSKEHDQKDGAPKK